MFRSSAIGLHGRCQADDIEARATLHLRISIVSRVWCFLKRCYASYVDMECSFLELVPWL
jgi:hypothetical protein